MTDSTENTHMIALLFICGSIEEIDNFIIKILFIKDLDRALHWAKSINYYYCAFASSIGHLD